MPQARDEGKPRGRMSAYAYFVQTCREEHRKKHPNENVAFKEFTRKCADRWRTMSEKEKARFHDLAKKDKARFDAEMKNYVPSGSSAKAAPAKRGGKKDPNAPKRSLSAFFWFCQEERPKVRKNHPEATVGEVAKILGKQWAEVTPSEKIKFEKKAEKDKARYDQEMIGYRKAGSQAPKAKAPPPKHEEEEDEEEEEEEEEEDEDDEGDDE